ncbi:MAG TPA: hypothetical protein PLR99_22275 [Polyangiaceae bacterium]|nr:hypothetical protein [Polyangiaceae bacterium]
MGHRCSFPPEQAVSGPVRSRTSGATHPPDGGVEASEVGVEASEGGTAPSGGVEASEPPVVLDEHATRPLTMTSAITVPPQFMATSWARRRGVERLHPTLHARAARGPPRADRAS